MINPYAIGKLCYLRIPEESDVASSWYEWFSDSEVTKYLTDRYWPNSKVEQLDFVKKLAHDKSRLVLLVCNLDTDSPIGVVSLGQINLVHRYAGFSFVVPPSINTDSRVTFEASTLILNVAFFKLNLLNIKTFTAANNHASISMQKLLGFEPVGEFYNIYNIDGNVTNEICMQLRIENWRKPTSG
jgi:RimJ/RimL family protein N-acetyltransferase